MHWQRTLLAALLLVPLTARAVDVGIKVEPGLAALFSPQADELNPGVGFSAKAMLGLGRYVDVLVGYEFIGFPWGTDPYTSGTSTAWGFGGGLRVKRPHDQSRFFGLSPWLDGDGLYVRTGPFDRFGYGVAMGVGMPLDAARRYWVGPFVRYLEVLPELANRDTKTFVIGLSLELGTSPLPAPPVPHLSAVPPEPERVETHNDDLSRRRADAVLEYLATTLESTPPAPGRRANCRVRFAGER
jgi:hypothetical protein